jgi:quercetin dioxygenase-like cupin family protein
VKPASNQPVGELILYAGIFLKTWTVPDAGMAIPQHAHEHDHLTYLISGVVRVWQDGEMLGDFRAPSALKIPARTKHKFLALTNGVVFACIHAVGVADDVAIAEEHALELEH